MKHVIRPTAKNDILRQFRYYLQQEAFDAADRFLEAVDNSIAAIGRMPDMGAPKAVKNPLLAGLRSWAVKDFEDILIFYVVRAGALCVVRVLSGRRDIRRILEREKDDGLLN